MPAQSPKAPKRIGPALADDDEPTQSPTEGTDPTDAQAANLAPAFSGNFNLASGYGPAFPGAITYGMGGEVTQPSDFSQEVAQATAVPSRGGPSAQELYASNKRGPIGKLKSPQEASATATPPEKKELPTPPKIEKAQPVSTADTAGASAPPPPVGAPTEAVKPGTVVSGGDTTAEEAAPQELPPSLQNRAFANRVKTYGSTYLDPNRDFSKVDDDIKNDPHFAGVDGNGVPVFMNENNQFYYREVTGPGTEKHTYIGLPLGVKDEETITDENKAQMSRDAATRLMAIIESKQAINDYNLLAKKVAGENPFQQGELGIEAGGGTSPADIALKTVESAAQHTPHWLGLRVTQPMRDLDAARARVANTYTQSMTKNIPTNEQVRTTLETPNASDSLAVQASKITNIDKAMTENANTLATMYPYQNVALKRQLHALYPNLFANDPEVVGPGGEKNAPAGSVARSGATVAPSTPRAAPSAAAASPTPTRIGSRQEFDALPSGSAFIDASGKVKYKR